MSASSPAASSSASRSTRSSAAMTKIPRPPNSFMLYRADKARAASMMGVETFYARLKRNSTEPAATFDRSRGAMSRDFAAMWRAESPQVRRQYEEAAEKRKAEHLRKYPGYRYQPARKRIAETKRRADAVSPTLRHHSTSPSASPMREATSMSQTAHQPAAERRPSPSERRPSSWALRGSGPEEATARTPSLAEEARWEYGDTFRRSAYAPDAHRGHHLSHDLRVDRSITYQVRTTSKLSLSGFSAHPHFCLFLLCLLAGENWASSSRICSGTEPRRLVIFVPSKHQQQRSSFIFKTGILQPAFFL
ncbi:hypothetical protein V8E36_001574 [Tilletia maclaganii]